MGNEAITKIWTRIETELRENYPPFYLSLAPGATETELASLEAVIGQSLPADIRASLARHNGQLADYNVYSLIGGWELLSCSRIEREWRLHKELLPQIAGWKTDDGGPVRGRWWIPEWIPIAGNGGGDFHCLDLKPGDSGRVGQIIGWWHDDSERPLLSESYQACLAEFCDELEKGEAYEDDDWEDVWAEDELNPENEG